jgi:hypothetical protein
MIALRDKSWRRFGASLAGLALYLQLAFASLGALALATPADPGDSFGEHALCLAAQAGSPQPAAPTDQGPSAPAHHHAAFCCLWHQLPGVPPVAFLAPQPAVYAGLIHGEPSATPFIPGRPHGPANARAPPTLV